MFAAQIQKPSAVLKQLIIPLPDFQESSPLSFSGIDGSLTWCELLSSCWLCLKKHLFSAGCLSFQISGFCGQTSFGNFLDFVYLESNILAF